MKVDDRIAPRAQKNQTAILTALAEVSQTRVAELIGESEATVSRFKGGDLERCAAIMAAVGLKAVLESQRFFSDDRIRALNILAKSALDNENVSAPTQCSEDEYRALKVLAKIALDTEGSSRWSTV